MKPIDHNCTKKINIKRNAIKSYVKYWKKSGESKSQIEAGQNILWALSYSHGYLIPIVKI